MRRPARQPHNIEGRPNAPIGIGKTPGVDVGHMHKRRAPQRHTTARHKRVGRPHAPQIVHQIESRAVARRYALDIGHRQGESRALQQSAELPKIGERRHTRRGAAFDFAFGLGKGLSQLRQGFAAKERRQKQSIRLERAADLREHTRQVIGKVQRQAGHDEIEA